VAKAWVLTHGLEAGIHFLLADYTQTPLHEVVVEDSFMELVEDIGCDAGENVGEGKVFPKRIEDWAQIFLIKLLQLFVSSHPPQGLQRRVNHAAACTFLDVATILRLNQTARATALFVATHKTLLRKISNIGSQDGMNSMHEAVSANHGLSLPTSINQWTQQKRHHIVE